MSEDEGWRLEIAPRAQRDFRRLDPPIQRRILTAIEGLIEAPPRGDFRRLTGRDDEWRLRVGDWRVRFSRDAKEQVVSIQRILPRGRAYER